MGADFSSQPIFLYQIYGFSLQAIFTRTPNGSFKLQGSNQDVKFGSSVTEWTDLSGSTVAVTAAGDALFNFNGAFFRWVRLVYTRSSGTGSCSVTFTSKGV